MTVESEPVVITSELLQLNTRRFGNNQILTVRQTSTVLMHLHDLNKSPGSCKVQILTWSFLRFSLAADLLLHHVNFIVFQI